MYAYESNERPWIHDASGRSRKKTSVEIYVRPLSTYITKEAKNAW